MKTYPLSNESLYEYYQDLSLGSCFLLLAILAGIRTRISFDPFGQGRVITTFYLLILFTALIRSVWFLIPSYILEGSYVPEPLEAFQSKDWIGCLVSELLLLTGSVLLYSQFILLISYWSYILRGSNIPTSSTSTSSTVKSNTSQSAFSTFTFIIILILLSEAINITLFILNIFNSQEMIIYDSILLSIISISTLIGMCVYSHKIRATMDKISKLNRNPNAKSAMTLQSNRIFQITIASVLFFSARVSVESSFAIACLKLMYGE
jgi:hypothetical protein